jgi:hypothetical protein
MRNWIRIYEPSIMESIRTAQSQAIHNTKSLSTYFTPIPSKRPPKPRFARNTRLLGDGRQKTRKRTKPLPNPTRNRITIYFQPRARPQPHYTTRSAPPHRRPISPYLPFHQLRNPYPTIPSPSVFLVRNSPITPHSTLTTYHSTAGPIIHGRTTHIFHIIPPAIPIAPNPPPPRLPTLIPPAYHPPHPHRRIPLAQPFEIHTPKTRRTCPRCPD